VPPKVVWSAPDETLIEFDVSECAGVWSNGRPLMAGRFCSRNEKEWPKTIETIECAGADHTTVGGT